MTWKDLKEEVRDFGLRPSERTCVWQHGEHLNKDDNNSRRDGGWEEKHCI